MFTIVLQEKGGEQRRMVFNKPEVTIGRVQGNDIVLPKGNVSKRHARIVLKDGKFIIVDLKSTNGTYVNGRKITSPLVVKDSDKIYIGDFIVGVDEASSGEGDGPSETTTSPPGSDMRVNAPPPDMRPPRPTEAQPMASLPIPMNNSADLPPPAAPVRPGPPNRPPPAAPPRDMSREMAPPPADMGRPPRDMGPTNDMGRPGRDREMPPPGDLGGGRPPRDMNREMAPPGDIGRPPRDMSREMAPPRDLDAPPPPGPGGRTMPPIASPRPVPGPAAERPRQPGGTMPPPMAPIPAPTQAPPAMEAAPAPSFAPPPMREAAPAPAPFSAPAPAPTFAAPSASPTPPPMGVASGGAQVVPLADKSKGKNLVGAGAKRVARSVSMPSRRGVTLDPLDPKVVKMLDLQSQLLERLRQKLDLDKIPMERLHEEELWQRAERATIDLVETLETSGELPKYIDQDSLIKETLSEALALGPLEDLLADEKIDEIIIDRRDRVVVGKDRVLRGSGKAFSSDEVFERVVKRLVAEAGARLDDANPIVDLRMRDGTRLTAAVSPVASRGAVLVLKKPATQMPQLADLAGHGTLSGGMADFLATCVTARRNILVCGAPASGKTTIVAALAAASPAGERVVSIEEVGELSIAREEWIQLETRVGVGKTAEVDLGTLLETAIRLSPDRLVVGEVRGREALPLVNALNASVDGAVVAMTGEGAAQALGRLATLARVGLSGADAPIRELVAQAFEIVVHVSRSADGSVKVVAIEEVVGCTESTFDTHVLFQLSNGSFHATGTVPRFYSELEARGIPADQAVFR